MIFMFKRVSNMILMVCMLMVMDVINEWCCKNVEIKWDLDNCGCCEWGVV